MKKSILLAFAATGLLLFVSCKKTEKTPGTTDSTLTVKAENKALLFDFSETWCPPCGSYAVPSFDQIVTDYENTNVCCVSIAGSSTPTDFNSKYSAAMSTDWAVTGVPSFFVNQYALSPTGGVYSNISSNVNWVKGKADIFKAEVVNAALALDKKIEGTMLTIRTKTKFYGAHAAGTDYRLAIYVVEDKLLADQATVSGTVKGVSHSNILRGGPTASYKGDALNSSVAVTANQEFDKNFTYTLMPTWNAANIKVIAVIWEVPATGKPTMINCNMVK